MSQTADFFGSDGIIARRLDGYEERSEQIELAKAVESALSQSRHLLAEAGTGVGKSFAYLLPAVLHAVAHRGSGPVVISTRTIALQEQLEHKDLPFLQSIMPIEWSAAIAVGRANYICLRRLAHAQRERGLLFPDPTRQAELQRITEWAIDCHGGTRMELEPSVSHAVWDEVRAEHGNCLYRTCKHYQSCPFQRNRRRLASAQILVVNHALYIADVALRMAGTAYLPDHRVTIFDEAHHLERIATSGLGLRLAPSQVLWHLRRLHPKRSQRSLLTRFGTPRARELTEEVRAAADEFFGALGEVLGSARTVALDDRVLPDPVSPLLLELGDELIGCTTTISEVDQKMEMQARANGVRSLAAMVQELCRPTGEPTVRWLESNRSDPELRSAPLEVNDLLRKWMFDEQRTCVLTSATLGPSGDTDFKWLRHQLGIDTADNLRLGSPFDYRQHVSLVIPDSMPDPVREPDQFLRACVEQVCERVIENGGRALVLCTSWRFVRAVADGLHTALADQDLRLLVQGDSPPGRLLQAKQEDPTSVLVGTESLWEGIDVPGDALTLVIVTRFPFAQPDHPLTRARLRLIEQRGGHAFLDHSLPEAILKFRQGFGRLIRSNRDRGQVVLLDPRVRTKRYGRGFLTALPDGVVDDPFFG